MVEVLIMKEKDLFLQLSACIKMLYDRCKKSGIYLDIIKIEPSIYRKQETEKKYEQEQNVWGRAETYEVMESLREGSPYYKGNPMKKSEIVDFMIDWAIEDSKKLGENEKKL